MNENTERDYKRIQDEVKLNKMGIISSDAIGNYELAKKQAIAYAKKNNINISVPSSDSESIVTQKIPAADKDSTDLVDVSQSLASGLGQSIYDLGSGLYNIGTRGTNYEIDKIEDVIGDSKILDKIKRNEAPEYRVQFGKNVPWARTVGELGGIVAVPELGAERVIAAGASKIPANFSLLSSSGLAKAIGSPLELGALSAVYGQGGQNHDNLWQDFMLGSFTGGVLKGTGTVANKIFKNYGTVVANRFLQGVKPSDINKEVIDEVRRNYENSSNISSNIYSDFFKKAEESGFSPNYSGIKKQTISSALGVPKKDIGQGVDASEGTMDLINSIKDSSNISRDTKDKISDYYSNMSLKNSHRLKSSLMKDAASLSSSADGSQRLFAGSINDAVRSLSSDIEKALPDDLSEMYKLASDNYKENVVPYFSSPIFRAIKDKTKSPRPTSLFKQTDENSLKVFDRLSDKSKDLSAADALRSYIKDSRGSPTINNIEGAANLSSSPQLAHFFQGRSAEQYLKNSQKISNSMKQLLSKFATYGVLNSLGLDSGEAIIGSLAIGSKGLTGISSLYNKVSDASKSASSRVGKISSGAAKLTPRSIAALTISGE